MRKFWANFFRISWKFILLGLGSALFLYFSDGKFCEKWLEEAIYLTGIFMIPILILLSLAKSLENSEWGFLDFLYVLFVVALAILFMGQFLVWGKFRKYLVFDFEKFVYKIILDIATKTRRHKARIAK